MELFCENSFYKKSSIKDVWRDSKHSSGGVFQIKKINKMGKGFQ